MVKPFGLGQPPRGGGKADHVARPLVYGPFPAIGGSVVRFVYYQQVSGSIFAPDLHPGSAPADGLGHQYDYTVGNCWSIVTPIAKFSD